MTKDTFNDDFIIKPISNSFDIIEMRQLIGQWRHAGLSDSHITKMQLLFFGEPAWMNLDKMYDSTRFQEMALGLKFHCRNDFLKVLIRCKGFGKIWQDDKQPHTPKNLMAFYTPLWHVPRGEEMDQQQEENGSEMQNGVCYIIDQDMINKKKNNKKKNISYYVSTHQNASADPQQSSPAPQPNAERERLVLQAAKDLLLGIAQNDDAYTQIVKPINELTERLIPDLYTNPEDPHPMNDATRLFFNQYVYPYLVKHGSKMMRITTIQGRVCWIRNLLQFKFMQQNIQRAVNDTRQYLALHAEEKRRQYRPLSPHEYQDRKTGERFYDFTDPKDQSLKTEPIPQEAEKRPSATARWNKFSKKWVDA